MYQATTTQRDWVYWLIRTDVGSHWISNYIFGETAMERLRDVLSIGRYDETTKSMLNFLLTEFNKETNIKKQYYDFYARVK